jgi:hypothetical protein
MEPYLTVSDILNYCQAKLDVSFGVLAEECRRQIAQVRDEQSDLAQ